MAQVLLWKTRERMKKPSFLAPTPCLLSDNAPSVLEGAHTACRQLRLEQSTVPGGIALHEGKAGESRPVRAYNHPEEWEHLGWDQPVRRRKKKKSSLKEVFNVPCPRMPRRARACLWARLCLRPSEADTPVCLRARPHPWSQRFGQKGHGNGDSHQPGGQRERHQGPGAQRKQGWMLRAPHPSSFLTSALPSSPRCPCSRRSP